MTRQIENNKRIAKNTLFMYGRLLFSLLINLYASRLILDALGVEDYGIHNIIAGIVTMLSFLTTTMSSTTQRFLTFEMPKNDSEALRKVFSTSINIHFLIAGFTLVIGETIGLWFLNHEMSIPYNRLYAANWIFQLTLVSTVISICSTPYNASVVAHERMDIFAYISILEIILKFIAVVLLFIIDGDRLILYSLFLLFTVLIIRLTYGIYCRNNFPETKYKFLLDRELSKKILSFASWNFFEVVSFIGSTQGLNLLLNVFFGPVYNAAYGISQQVQNALSSLYGSFQRSVAPQITKSYAIGDFRYMKKLTLASSKYSFLLIFLIAFPVYLEVDTVLNLWLSNFPTITREFVRFALGIELVIVLLQPLLTAISATGDIKKFHIISNSFLILVLPAAYLALRLGAPPESVFFIRLLLLLIVLFVRVIILGLKIDFSFLEYLKVVLCPIMIIAALALVIPAIILILMDASTTRLALVFSTTFIITLTSVYYVDLKNEQRKEISEYSKLVIKRLFTKK